MQAVSPSGQSSGRGYAQFEHFFAVHCDAVLAFVLQRTNGPDAAADVVVETFLKAWRRLATIPDGDAARLWLYQVATQAVRRQRQGSQLSERASVRAWCPTSSPPATGLVAEIRAAITSAFQRLPADRREVLQLVVVDGLEAGQAARVLGWSMIGLRLRLRRARRQFAEELDQAGVQVQRA